MMGNTFYMDWEITLITWMQQSLGSIGQVLSDHDIAVRTGLHCAPESHRFLGTAPNGTVRFSVSYFTNNTDLEALDEALEYIEMS